MATTAVSGTGTTNATSAITALGAGSGMDVKTLATSLVDAERQPTKQAIDKKIKTSEGNISGYAAVKYVLDTLKTTFSDLKDESDFNSITPANSQPSAVSVSAGATAGTGSHSVSVSALAKAQRNISASFASPNTVLNAGAAFNLTLSVHGGASRTLSVPQGFTTPLGVVAAINSSSQPVAAIKETQSVTLTGVAAASGSVSFLGVAVNGSALGDNASTTAALLVANKATILAGAAAKAAGITDIAAANGVLTLSFADGTTPANGTGDVSALAASASSNGISFSQGAELIKGVQGVAANAGVKAQLINTGDAAAPYKIMLTGPTGVASDFTLTADNPPTGVTWQTTQGSANTTESTAISFANALSAGQSVTVGGLTYTSTGDTTAAQLAAAFALLADGASTGAAAATGTYSGKLNGFSTGAVSNDGSLTVTATSTTPNANVSDLVVLRGLDFSTVLQSAQNASLTVNGVAISSASNRVEGAISGATLNLSALTTGSGATLEFSRDTSAVKTKLQALVTAYNDANTMFGVVSDPKSTVETYGATLVGSTTVTLIRSQMRALVTGNSSTPSSTMGALRDLGITMSRSGELQLDAAKLDTALNAGFDSAVTMLSANRENTSPTSLIPAGLAGDAVKKLSAMVAATGALTTQSANATTKIADYKKQLEKLETRMTALLARYTKQFGAMESMVGQTKSLQTSLTSTFDGMMAMYTNK